MGVKESGARTNKSNEVVLMVEFDVWLGCASTMFIDVYIRLYGV